MRLEAKTHLRDIADACRCIEEETASVEVERYSSNRVLRAAVERWFTIVGEAGTRLMRLEPALERELPDLRRAIGFRNVILHQYDELDPVIVGYRTRLDFDVPVVIEGGGQVSKSSLVPHPNVRP